MASSAGGATIVLWEGADHKARAETLTAMSPDIRLCAQIDTQPKAVPGLETLVLWGHGDAYGFCHKNARGIHEVIKSWKARNPGLQIVEMLSCNLQHGVGKDPFAVQLKTGIGRFSSLRGMKIRTFPRSLAGAANAWSILFAEPLHKTWMYVTAPGNTDAKLMELKQLVTFEINKAGKTVSYNGSLITKAEELRKKRADGSLPAMLHNCRWTMNYGHFNSLRRQLVEV